MAAPHLAGAPLAGLVFHPVVDMAEHLKFTPRVNESSKSQVAVGHKSMKHLLIQMKKLSLRVNYRLDKNFDRNQKLSSYADTGRPDPVLKKPN